MKVIGGSFGVKGSACISADNCLVVDACGKHVVKPGGCASCKARTEKSKGFGVFGFIVGGAVLAAILFAVIGAVGALIGIAFAAAGSFYSQQTHFVDVELNDGRSLTLECTPRGVQKLMKWSGLK